MGGVSLLAASIGFLAVANGQTIGDPDANGKYWIHAEGISAAFIPYGASITNLLIKDRYGIQRDLIAGFDNASYYTTDPVHPHLGGVPGRYANRIRNSSFEIDGTTFHIEPNENPSPKSPAGADTLHGGPDGWDYRNFSIVSYTQDSITFSIVDPDGKEGFPGEVISTVTYKLSNMTWEFNMVAVATTKKTPIMLTSHPYWNLDGFANNETQTVFDHVVYMPYSGQRVGVDSILIPTGDILANKKGSVNDFWSAPKRIGEALEPDEGGALKDSEIEGNCGAGCTGYDNCWLVNRDSANKRHWDDADEAILNIYSPWSGIRLDIYSDQDAVQLYSCNGQNGSLPLQSTQGIFGDEENFPRTIPQYGCVVLEVQDWIDGVNHPEWGREAKHVFSPGGDPFVLRAKYKFSVH